MQEHLLEELRIRDERYSDNLPLDISIFDQQVKIICHQPVLTIGSEATIAEAVIAMKEKKRGAAIVTGPNKKIVGIVTERDLLTKVYGTIEEPENTAVTEIMTANPVCLYLTDSISFVMNKMHIGGYRHIPIIDENHIPLHLVSMRHVISYVLDHFPREVINLPLQPFRGVISRDGG